MFVRYRTKGLVINKQERGEADELLTLYTKDYGKIKILARAIRKISSKLRSGIDIFYLSEIEFIQGRIYKRLTDAFVVEKFSNLRKNIKKLTEACRISKVLEDIISVEEKDERIWNLLLLSFKNLDKSESGDIDYNFPYYYFVWNLFSFLGYRPELYFCVVCQKKPEPSKVYFSEAEGGIVCDDCAKSMERVPPVTEDVIKILRIILRNDWNMFSRLKINKLHLKLLDDISQKYFLYFSKKYSISSTEG